MLRPAVVVLLLLAVVAGCGQGDLDSPYDRGQAALRTGSFDEAIEEFTQAVRIEPSSAGAYLHRGRAYHGRNAAGDLDAAIDDFDKAIDLSPNNWEAYYSRSYAYRDRAAATHSEEDIAQANADAKKARELDPSIADTFATLPELADPAEGVIPPPPREAEPEESAKKKESPFAARRRLSAAADAALEEEVRKAAEQRDRLEAARGQSAADENEEGTAKDQRPFGQRRRIYPEVVPEADDNARGLLGGIPPGGGVPGALDPQSPAANAMAPALTPTPTAPAPHRGGTLPPVGASPFVTRNPGALPPSGSVLPGDPSALQGAAPAASPFQTPFQSPFGQQMPRPTGIVPSPAPAGSSVRAPAPPRVTPIPGRINFPATTRRGVYDP